MTYQSINPYNGKHLKTFEQLSDPQLEQALETSANCFEVWRKTTFAHRASVATKVATILRNGIDKFARTMTLEMGKRIEESRGEVMLGADIIDYYAKKR